MLDCLRHYLHYRDGWLTGCYKDIGCEHDNGVL